MLHARRTHMSELEVAIDDRAQQRGEDAPYRDEPGHIEPMGRGKGQHGQNAEDLHCLMRRQQQTDGGRFRYRIMDTAAKKCGEPIGC